MTPKTNVEDVNAFPSKDINKCPAIKFAVRRTHNVIGRIMFLTSSIITMNIIRAEGVPWGTRCANIWFVFFVHPNSIKEVQNINEIGSVIVKWEVGEKIWGYKAKKFIVKIIKNNIKIITSLPFSFLFKVNLTSFLNVKISFFPIIKRG